MNKYYYNTESEVLESIDTIRSDYELFKGEEYESFEDYLTACMWYENGVLIDVSDRIREVKEELNQKMELANKYGMDEYMDELAELLEELDTLNKAKAGKA